MEYRYTWSSLVSFAWPQIRENVDVLEKENGRSWHRGRRGPLLFTFYGPQLIMFRTAYRTYRMLRRTMAGKSLRLERIKETDACLLHLEVAFCECFILESAPQALNSFLASLYFYRKKKRRNRRRKKASNGASLHQPRNTNLESFHLLGTARDR